jgi:hypothetical protein
VSDGNRRLLDAIRLGLREEILPKLRSEYDRSVVIAMIGILGEVAPRIAADDAWVEASVGELREGAKLWAEWLAARPEPSSRIRELTAASESSPSPAEARRLLLEAAELAISTLWGDEELRRATPGALEDLRSRLVLDLARQSRSARLAKPPRD